MRDLSIHLAVPAVVLALALLVSAEPGGAESNPMPAAKLPYLVKIHADWCGTCMRLEPLWKRLGEECGGAAHLVRLDVTDRETTADSARLAASLGLGEFFDSHKSMTGTISLIDPTTYRPIAVFEGEMDFARYEDALADAGGCGM